MTAVVGAECTRVAVRVADSHTVKPRPDSERFVWCRRDALPDSVDVFDRLHFTGVYLYTVSGCRQSRQSCDHRQNDHTAVYHLPPPGSRRRRRHRHRHRQRHHQLTGRAKIVPNKQLSMA